MDHPFHLHGFLFQVLEVNGKPPAFRSWEDTVNISPKGRGASRGSRKTVQGSEMHHCHILEHHAARMMAHVEWCADPEELGSRCNTSAGRALAGIGRQWWLADPILERAHELCKRDG